MRAPLWEKSVSPALVQEPERKPAGRARTSPGTHPAKGWYPADTEQRTQPNRNRQPTYNVGAGPASTRLRSGQTDADRRLARSSTSLTSRAMPTTAPRRSPLTPVRTATLSASAQDKAGEDVGKGPSHGRWERRRARPRGKRRGASSENQTRSCLRPQRSHRWGPI